MRVRKSPQSPMLYQYASGGPKTNISFSGVSSPENTSQYINSRSAVPRKFVLHSPEELINQSTTKMFNFNSLPPINKETGGPLMPKGNAKKKKISDI